MALKPLYNEKYLLEKIVQGNQKAFSELFYAYHNQLAGYVYMLTDCRQMTQEIIQDVFLKIWDGRLKLLRVENFTAYLFILTRNHTLNNIRKAVNNRKWHNEYQKTNIDDSMCDVNDGAEVNYDVLLKIAIAHLPAQQQLVVQLRQQGFKNDQIAERLRLSPHSVKKYYQWALKSMAKWAKSNAATVGVAFCLLLKI